MSSYIIFGIILYILSYTFYVKSSHGLGHKAEYLQLRRFIPCAILAVLPLYLTHQALFPKKYLSSLFIGIAWIVTYPIFYYLTYHKSSSDFGFHLDTVFGLYITGWMISLKLLVHYFNFYPIITLTLITILEFLLLLIPLIQIFYYLLYKTCIDVSSITLVFETYTNEIIEFFKSLPLFTRIASVIIPIVVFCSLLTINLTPLNIAKLPIINLSLLIAVTAFLTVYLWKTRKGVFIRTGIVELFLDVKDYLKQTASYKTSLAQRISTLSVTTKTKFANEPATIILVIGESESRDYMNAFGYEKETTPWLSKHKNDKNFILFPHAYSCKGQTVPSLERAFTEVNQYNNKKFYESCSFVDIARKLGFKISWFSNQSHIGSADTPITLVANTADKAEWTKLHLNQVQYDDSLLDYLPQINANENNFIVFHLKGSHFNYINRYPQTFAKFSKPNKYDLIPNYLDSVAYTDYVLKHIQKYAQEHLNLQAMIYFSDHAVTPDKRRSPKFNGFAGVRIPLITYFSDEYIKNHQQVYDALQANKEKYWTNDLAYELICGILDIESNHYDESNSLASAKYKYTRDMLLTELGEMHISEDKDG